MFIMFLYIIGQLSRTSGFIDIPTVPQYDTRGMLGGSIVFSLPMYGNDPIPTDSIVVDPADFDMVLRYGLGKTELALAMFTPTTWVASVSHLIKPEKDNSPAFFVGIDDISYNKHISTLGMGGNDGTIEEQTYNRCAGGRVWELFSTYIAMQKSFGSMTNFVLGLGRGRFVGNSWRSHIFNTDLFIIGNEYKTKPHSWWVLGLFMGGAFKFPFGLEMSVEMDGRDANLGLKYHTPLVTATLALCKVEYLGSFRPYSPRWTFGLDANNRSTLAAPNIGSIEVVIQNIMTKELIPDAVVDISEINKRYKAASGIFKMSLPVGAYTISITAPNYEDYIAKITIKPGALTKSVFNMKKTEEAMRREFADQERETSIKTYLSQGKVYFSEGNLTEARKAFEMVISLEPDNFEAKDFLTNIESRRQELINAYLTEAKKSEAANDYAKAIECYRKVLELDPQNAECARALAAMKTKTSPPKKPPAAAKPQELTKKATPEEIEVIFKKGATFFANEQYDDALKIFNQVLALDPKHKGAKDYKKRTQARIKALKGGG